MRFDNICDDLIEDMLTEAISEVEVILYSKECNWYTRCCLLINAGVCYRQCPLREVLVLLYINFVLYLKICRATTYIQAYNIIHFIYAGFKI